jgi:3-oxoadipate enol-lactonase
MNFIQANGATIHYKFIQQAELAEENITFLFINSLGTDFRIWDDVAEILKPYGNILLYDKRGHGLSGLQLNAVNGLDAYAEDTLQLISALSLQSLIVIGISLGGMIAQLIACKKPRLIRKLILCDTGHAIGTPVLWNTRIQNIKDKGLCSISDDIIKKWVSARYYDTHTAQVEGIRNMLERVNADGYIKACEVIRGTDLTLVAKQIQIPALCIAGSEDVSTPPELVKRLSGFIKGSLYKVIDNSGHLPCIDNPEILSKLIIDFISNDE